MSACYPHISAQLQGKVVCCLGSNNGEKNRSVQIRGNEKERVGEVGADTAARRTTAMKGINVRFAARAAFVSSPLLMSHPDWISPSLLCRLRYNNTSK
jgi:hypothetical protein